MKKKIFYFLVTIVFFLSLQANSEMSVAPENKITINYGDKVSTFGLWKTDNFYNFKYMDSYGKSKAGRMSQKDYDFVVKKLAQTVNEKSNDMSFCYRRNMIIETLNNGKTIIKKSCIGSPTKISKKTTEIANILQLLL